MYIEWIDREAMREEREDYEKTPEYEKREARLEAKREAMHEKRWETLREVMCTDMGYLECMASQQPLGQNGTLLITKNHDNTANRTVVH